MYLKARTSRSPLIRKAASAALAAGAVLIGILTLANPNLLIFYAFIAACYFIISSERISPWAKFWAATLPFFILILLFAPHVFSGSLLPMLDKQAIVGLDFFNFFVGFPFFAAHRLTILSAPLFTDTVEQFISAQAMFSFRHAPGLVLLACMGFSFFIVRTFAGLSPRVSAPGISDFAFPKWMAVLSAALAFVFYFQPDNEMLTTLARVLWPPMMALLAAQGLALAVIFTGGRRTGPGGSGTILFFAVILLEPFFVLTAAAGAADIVFGLRKLAPEAVDCPGDTVNTAGRTGCMPAIIIVVVIVAVVSFSAIFSSRHGVRHGFILPSIPPLEKVSHHTASLNETNDIITISGGDKTFSIDRYEYPDTRGEMPLTSVNPAEAASLCSKRGGRLCTPAEWTMACRAGENGYAFFITPDRTGSRLSIDRKCSKDKISPSGSFPDCTNPYGLVDMMGNAWEIVEPENGSMFVILMGQGAGSGYELLNRCNWMQVLFEDQFDDLPTEIIGFRCCYDGSPVTN